MYELIYFYIDMCFYSIDMVISIHPNKGKKVLIGKMAGKSGLKKFRKNTVEFPLPCVLARRE